MGSCVCVCVWRACALMPGRAGHGRRCTLPASLPGVPAESEGFSGFTSLSTLSAVGPCHSGSSGGDVVTVVLVLLPENRDVEQLHPRIFLSSRWLQLRPFPHLKKQKDIMIFSMI